MDETRIETVQDSQEVPELTPEQKEQQEKFFRGFVIKRNHYTLRSIFDYLRSNHITLEQAKQEIEAKKCGLTRSQRDFIVSFKLDFLGQLLSDMYGDRYKPSDSVESSTERRTVDSEQGTTGEGAE